jgi:hypothetical protein
MGNATIAILTTGALTLLGGAPSEPAGAKNQELAKAIRQALDDAGRAAADIPPPFERAVALAEVGRVQLVTGDKKSARKTFRRAVEVAHTLPTKDGQQAREQFALLFRIAHAMVDGGEFDGARKFVDEICTKEPLRQFVRDPESSAWSIRMLIARRQQLAGNIDDAIQTAHPGDERDAVYTNAAQALAEARNWARAEKLAGRIERER